MKSNNGYWLPFTNQQALDFTVPSDVGITVFVLFYPNEWFVNSEPTFFFKRVRKYDESGRVTYLFIEFLRRTTDARLRCVTTHTCPWKSAAVLTAICSVNCNNCDSIVKLRAGTPHLSMLNGGEMSLDWIRLVPQRNHCLFVCRKWCVDANRGGTETSNKFYANENPNENISPRNELARVNCLHFLSVRFAAWDLIFKYTNDAAQPMTLQPLEIFFVVTARGERERHQIGTGRESRYPRFDVSETSCDRLQRAWMLILWKKAVLRPTPVDVRSAIAPGDKRVLSASLRRGVTAIWSAVDKAGASSAPCRSESELQKCNAVDAAMRLKSERELCFIGLAGNERMN